jgi:hypothetical protein
MRKLVFASLTAIAIGFAFAPGAMAAPAAPAGIGVAATASSPVVKAWWYRRHYWGWRRSWRHCNRWRCW